MDALTTDARHTIAAALLAAGLPAFPYVPETVTLPAVLIIPADPYIVLDRVGRELTYTANFRVHVVAQALDNATGLALAETLIDATLEALPDGTAATRVGPPLLDDLGAQGSAFVAEIAVSAHVAKSPTVTNP